MKKSLEKKLEQIGRICDSTDFLNQKANNLDYEPNHWLIPRLEKKLKEHNLTLETLADLLYDVTSVID